MPFTNHSKNAKSYWKINPEQSGMSSAIKNEIHKFSRMKRISQQSATDGILLFSDLYDVRGACKTCCYSIEF